MNYEGSFTGSFAITPHDSNPLPAKAKAIFVGGAGALNIRLPDDTADILLSGIAAGTVLPISPTHIRSSSTTATLLRGLY